MRISRLSPEARDTLLRSIDTTRTTFTNQAKFELWKAMVADVVGKALSESTKTSHYRVMHPSLLPSSPRKVTKIASFHTSTGGCTSSKRAPTPLR